MPFELANFYNETRNARKIIVVDLGYLGDSIHLLPALCEIEDNYPRAELHVASASIGSEFLQMATPVDRTWPLQRTPQGASWREQWRWIRQVRNEHFDVAFNFSGTDRTVFLTFASGARWRVAFAGGRRHFYNPWLIPYWIPRVDRTVHVAEQRRQVLAACGLQLGRLRYPIQLPGVALRWAEQSVPPGAIHLSINAGHGLKEWPLERWIELTQHLLQCPNLPSLVVSGSRQPREQARLERFFEVVRNPRVLPFAGSLSLAQLAALLGRCQLHIGADSGALHLAAVLGVKTVSIFRDYEGIGEWMPKGEDHRSIVASCQCVNQRVQPCQATGTPVCLDQVAAELVWREIAVLCPNLVTGQR